MSDPIQQFRDAIHAAGLTPPDTVLADGKLHRFASNGKARDDAGWYVFHGDGIPAGSFGDWRTGLSENWRADIGRTLTPAETAAHRQRMEAARAEREAEETRQRERAVMKTVTLWKAASPARADHPYLVRKGVQPVPTLREIEADALPAILGYAPHREGETLAGRILVAPVKIGDKLSTAELIDESGRKSAIAGGAKSGGHWGAQALPDGDGNGVTLLIGEGVATVLSAKQATGHHVIAALTCGNLAKVANAMRGRYPAASIVILADVGNGQSAAEQAAQSVSGRLAVPDFGANRSEDATDFNDLHRLAGLEAVRAGVEGAATLTKPEPIEAMAGLVCAADIKPEAINWLWPSWIAAGKLHIIAGAPGTGKTTIALAMAATITSGGKWPDGTPADAGSVLMWSSEDDPKDTLVPRLRAMDADVSRFHFVTSARDGEKRRPFDPATDMPQLESEIRRRGIAPKLLIVDPIVSAVAADSHKNGETRRALQPLVDMGHAHGCAVIGISHFSKGTGGREVTERVTGSLAFGALARIVLAAAKMSEEQGGGRMLVRGKSNIGPDSGGYQYDLQQVEVSGYTGVSASRLLWGASIEGSAREILAQAEALEDGEERSQQTEAVEWLSDLLFTGRMKSRDVHSKAKQSGFAWSTVERAARKLGVIKHREGFGPDMLSYWVLPSVPSNNTSPVIPFKPKTVTGMKGMDGNGAEGEGWGVEI